jgi:hypothetical protein
LGGQRQSARETVGAAMLIWMTPDSGLPNRSSGYSNRAAQHGRAESHRGSGQAHQIFRNLLNYNNFID